VDAYGVPRYKEINPAVLSMVSFPFLFGVMFGDVGHGILMLLFVGWMLWKEEALLRDKNMGEILEILFAGRYIILLMSLFSLYCGFMYNEAFGIPVQLFPSMWVQNPKAPAGPGCPGPCDLVPDPSGYVYPFGADPIWHEAQNTLFYFNSLKMKMSVLLGVAQMVTGIVLSALNARYFNKVYDFWFEFVPQLIFMCSLFGYLCVLVLIKWFTEYAPGDYQPPLLNTFLQMFLSPMKMEEKDILYPGQHAIQVKTTSISCQSLHFRSLF
tara:strand:+ start:235 stop:1038 length:804 start_codon:yes stop_codon:yes gene_type:complete